MYLEILEYGRWKYGIWKYGGWKGSQLSSMLHHHGCHTLAVTLISNQFPTTQRFLWSHISTAHARTSHAPLRSTNIHRCPIQRSKDLLISFQQNQVQHVITKNWAYILNYNYNYQSYIIPNNHKMLFVHLLYCYSALACRYILYWCFTYSN